MLSIMTNDEFIHYIITMLFVGIGVFGKDYENTISGKDEKIYFFRIIFVMIVNSTLLLAFKTYLMQFNIFFYWFLCITAGWLNYSVVGLLDYSGAAMMGFFKKFIDAFFRKDLAYEKLKEEIDQLKEQTKKDIDSSGEDEENKE